MTWLSAGEICDIDDRRWPRTRADVHSQRRMAGGRHAEDGMTEHMTTGQYADRRSGQDRRMIQQFRPGPERRSGFDRRTMHSGGPGDSGAARHDRLPSGNRGSGRRPRARGTNAPYPPSIRDFLAGVGTVLTQLVSGFYDASMDPKLWPEVLGQAAGCRARRQRGGGFARLRDGSRPDRSFGRHRRDVRHRLSRVLQPSERLAAAVPRNSRSIGKVLTSQQLGSMPATVVDTDFYRYWLRPQNLLHSSDR